MDKDKLIREYSGKN